MSSNGWARVALMLTNDGAADVLTSMTTLFAHRSASRRAADAVTELHEATSKVREAGIPRATSQEEEET